MRQMEKGFKICCRQITLMNNQIRSLKKRYDRAIRRQKRSFRYNYRLRLVTLEGVRNTFWVFAHDRADRLDELQDQLLTDYNIDWDDLDESDSDSIVLE